MTADPTHVKTLSSLTIEEVMTRQPFTIRDNCALSVAYDVMRAHEIRHLPVLGDSGDIVGVLSHRDLYVFEAVAPRDLLHTVEFAMTRTPYCVTPTCKLRDVALTLAERRMGCAVVVQGSRVVGIFTADDGLRVLARIIDQMPNG